MSLTSSAPEIPLQTCQQRLSTTPFVLSRQREASHFQPRFRGGVSVYALVIGGLVILGRARRHPRIAIQPAHCRPWCRRNTSAHFGGKLVHGTAEDRFSTGAYCPPDSVVKGDVIDIGESASQRLAVGGHPV